MKASVILFSAFLSLAGFVVAASAQDFERDARNQLNALVDQAESGLRAATPTPSNDEVKNMLHLADVAILKRFLAAPEKLDSMKSEIDGIVNEVSIEYHARAHTRQQGLNVADQAIATRGALMSSQFRRAMNAYVQSRRDATRTVPVTASSSSAYSAEAAPSSASSSSSSSSSMGFLEQILIPPTPTAGSTPLPSAPPAAAFNPSAGK